MELKKCSQGHYYDGSLYQECPTCKELRENGGNVGATEGFWGASGGFRDATDPTERGTVEETVPPTARWETTEKRTGATVPLTEGGRSQQTDGATIAIIQSDMGIDPVVGWLVSLNGKEKGRDYRIHSDNNFIGRGEQMDICIRGDETISRVNHAVVSYDTRDRLFYFSRGDGRSIVRLNGKAMLTTVELNAYDVIEIGKTQLLFIPLCGERFEWKENEDSNQ